MYISKLSGIMIAVASFVALGKPGELDERIAPYQDAIVFLGLGIAVLWTMISGAKMRQAREAYEAIRDTVRQ